MCPDGLAYGLPRTANFHVQLSVMANPGSVISLTGACDVGARQGALSLAPLVTFKCLVRATAAITKGNEVFSG
jgi:hypothetical protein